VFTYVTLDIGAFDISI